MSRFAWQRHPRYTLSVFLILVATFYFLNQYETSQPLLASTPPFTGHNDHDLPSRMERAERIYNKVLHDRQGLIRKFGPTPSEVAMFPPDKDPWPAYTAWDFFPPAFNCPHELERIGALGDGGKWICGLSRVAEKPDCIVYSFGTNYESSFENEVLSRTRHCQIWAYDSTVNSHGPRVDRIHHHRTHFLRFGLASVDAHGPQDSPKAYTLESLMAANGHKHIDILKIDVEGWEFDIMASIVRPFVTSGEPLPFGQLNLEMHVWNKKFAEFLSWWEMLETAGLRPFMTEANLVYQNYNKHSNTELAEYSFLNIKGYNSFIADSPSSKGTTGAEGQRNPTFIRHGPRPTD